MKTLSYVSKYVLYFKFGDMNHIDICPFIKLLCFILIQVTTIWVPPGPPASLLSDFTFCNFVECSVHILGSPWVNTSQLEVKLYLSYHTLTTHSCRLLDKEENQHPQFQNSNEGPEISSDYSINRLSAVKF